MSAVEVEQEQPESVEEVHTQTYVNRQKESFERAGGGPEGWRPTPLRDIQYKYSEGDTLREGKPLRVLVFDLPEGYQTVYPYSEMLAEKDGDSKLVNTDAFCQLCGWAPLQNHWPIQNDERELLMWVGCVCVDDFMGAHFTSKTVKKFQETKLRSAYATWYEKAFEEIEKHREPSWTDKWKIVHQGWMPEPLYKFIRKLTPPEETSARKIANRFKEARELHIPIPAGMFYDQTPDETVDATFGVKVLSKSEAPKKTEPEPIQQPIQKPEQKYKTRWDSGRVWVLIGNQWIAAVKNSEGIFEPIQNPSSSETRYQEQDLSKISVGAYQLPNGDIYIVRPSRNDKSRRYAKKMVKAPSERSTESGDHVDYDFVYESGAIYKLRPEYRLSEERAKELSIKYNHCIVCGRRLKVAASIDRGMGSVCFKVVRGSEEVEA